MGDISNLKGKKGESSKRGSKKGKQGRNLVLLNRSTELGDLPSPILQNILSRLPLRSILCCKLVNKEWNQLTKEPNFPKLHLSNAAVCPILRAIDPQLWPRDLHIIEATNTNDLVSPLKLYYKILPPRVPLILTHASFIPTKPKFGIVNSCHGLLCVCTTPFNNPIYVCNPITREYMMLPKPGQDTVDHKIGIQEVRRGSMINFVFSGFGFSPRTNKYKVMRILESYSEMAINIQIFTLGTRKWRTIGQIEKWDIIGVSMERRPTILPTEAHYKQSSCVYLDGAVHWLGSNESTPIFICSFSFDEEEFFLVQPPVEFCNKKHTIEDMTFGVLNDGLYLSDTGSDSQFELWVLKDYEDPSSWTKKLVINTLSLNITPRGSYQPIKYLDNGDLLMFHESNALVSYNPKEQSFRYFKIRGMKWDFEMVPHIPSIVSMKDAIKVTAKRVQIYKLRKSIELIEYDWDEPREFLLVEEDVSATSSKTVEENTYHPVTDRHL